MNRLPATLARLVPLVQAAIAELHAETAGWEEEARAAETAPYSWDHSGPAGARARLEEHRELLETLERLAAAIEEARAALGRG